MELAAWSIPNLGKACDSLSVHLQKEIIIQNRDRGSILALARSGAFTYCFLLSNRITES